MLCKSDKPSIIIIIIYRITYFTNISPNLSPTSHHLMYGRMVEVCGVCVWGGVGVGGGGGGAIPLYMAGWVIVILILLRYLHAARTSFQYTRLPAPNSSCIRLVRNWFPDSGGGLPVRTWPGTIQCPGPT